MTAFSCALSNVKKVMNAPMRLYLQFMAFLTVTFLTMQPTYCAKLNTNISMENLFGSMVEIVLQIALYVGALITVSGVFSLIMAYKDDNGATRSAVKSCSA